MCDIFLCAVQVDFSCEKKHNQNNHIHINKNRDEIGEIK